MQKEKTKLNVGDMAPEFRLEDQNGKWHTLGEYKTAGKKVLLYFYPKDDTPGCTTEACNFRDSFESMSDSGLVILGVSKDSVKSHKKFADKYNLNFPILSDETGEVVKSYDSWAAKKFMGREFLGILRKSFLIATDGRIEKIYEKVNTKTHASEVAGDII
jgi:thioredoxin-dependent peroxiredoxin